MPTISKETDHGQEPIAYLLRIELLHLKPAIYREVLVDPSISLNKLHKIIQAAMGWEDYHLYGFAEHSGKSSSSYWNTAANRRYEPPNDDDFGMDGAQSDRTTRVENVLRAPKDKLLYVYDFGDCWEHKITLKSIVRTAHPLPWLIKAQSGCPPEDCGGYGGFIDKMQALADPSHPQHEEVQSWLGADFEPGALDFPALQRAVSKFTPKTKAARRS